MKKIFTILTTVAAVAFCNAQNLTILESGIGTIPGYDGPALVGLGMSANGRYVCGTTDYGMGYFVYDTQSKTCNCQPTDDENEGSELRNVSDFGLAIGYNGPGYTFSIDGVGTVLEAPNLDAQSIIGEDLTSDGSIKIGSIMASTYLTKAAFCDANDVWHLLPMPADSLLGDFAKKGSMAKRISGDGKVILGHIGNFGPAIFWTLNENGEYEYNHISGKYTMLTNDDTEKDFTGFNPISVSDNGKLILLQVAPVNKRLPLPAVYNIETEELTVYEKSLDIIDELGYSEFNVGLQPSSISNDGTIIGIIGSVYANGGGFIINAGEEKAQIFADVFPKYVDMFMTMDAMSHVPVEISADGRYIAGYGFYSAEPEAEDAPAYYITYVLDRGEGNSVREISSGALSNEASDFFGIDGNRHSSLVKGINIVKMNDGSVRKILK